MTDYLPKHNMFDHQEKLFKETRDKEFYALLWEMGLGKTKAIIDNASWLYATGEIEALLVISPNGLTRVWKEQADEHTPDYINHKAMYFSCSATKEEQSKLVSVLKHDKGLKIVSINVEALTTVKGVSFCKSFLINYKTMLVIDESTTIKSPKAIRTKNILKLGKHSKYRRILTGTPTSNSPLDLYTQFSFLDEHILRCGSYFAFRGQYAIMKPIRISGGREIQVVDRYCNLEHLQKIIGPHSSRLLKTDCLNLPEKLFQKRYVDLSVTQRKLYIDLKKNLVIEFDGKTLSTPLALTKLMRLQQIVGGYFQTDQQITTDPDSFFELPQSYAVTKPVPIDERNPRVESLIELLEETQGKVIIWARFRAEIGAISDRISESFGKESLVQYHGGIGNEERSLAVQSFQNSDRVRFFVGHVQAGGKGLTLHAAQTVVYFSNNFSLEDRLQSEDRAHRIGQTKNVLYIDFIASNTLDETVVATLRSKKSVADLITGDPDLSWI